MRKRRGSIAGKIITGLFLLIEAAFLGLLYSMKMIPMKYLAVIGVVLLVFGVFVGVLTRSTRKKTQFAAGTVFAVLFAAVFILGGKYIYETTSAISGISGVNTEVSRIGIYVRAEDKAETITDTKGYTYGILEELDRENTDETLKQLSREFDSDVQTKEYRGLTALVEGLLNEETGAIILNQAYLPVLEEMGGDENWVSQIREVGVKSVETVVEKKPVKDQTDKENSNGDVYTVYISGIDNRGALIAKSRSDVNIIAVANTKTRQLLLVSTPRDYFVPLSISDGVPDKLTHAGIYGVNVSMDTLGMLYDMDIKDYFRMNFGGFKNIVDALGGVTVMSDYDFSASGFHYNKGANNLNGEQALAFARERHSFAEGDRQRGKNQMAVIKGVVNKALSPELLKNYSSVMASMEGSFETSFAYEEIARVVQQQLSDGGAWNIVSCSVDGTGDTQQPYSMSQKAYVMIPDQKTVDKAKDLMKKVRDGEIISQE